MGNFKLPIRQFIINDDIQGVLRADKAGTFSDYAGGTDLDPTVATHLFKITGQTDWTKVTNLQLLAAATRVRKQVWATAVKGVKAFTLPAAVTEGDVFRIVWDSLDKTPVEYQNIPLEKRYQFSKTISADAAAVVANMVAVINADPNSPVIAYAGFNNVTPAQDDSTKIVLVAKNFREEFQVYSTAVTLTAVAVGTTVYHTAEDTSATTAVATDYVNDYENLKNKQWVADLDFDRNAEYYPQKGAKYNSYFYKVDFTQDTGGHTVPGQKAVTGEVTFVFYVKQGIALDTALDAFATDMNV